MLRSRPIQRPARTACELLDPPIAGSLSVHQLHQLRSEIHNRPGCPLRPAAVDDGRLSNVLVLSSGSTTIQPTAAFTPSQTPVRNADRRLRC